MEKMIIYCIFEHQFPRGEQHPVLHKAFRNKEKAEQFCNSIIHEGYNMTIKPIELE